MCTPKDKMGNRYREGQTGASWAVGCKLKSHQEHRHLPEDLVHLEIQVILAAQGDPEDKARECEAMLRYSRKCTENNPVQKFCGYREESQVLCPGEFMLIGVFRPSTNSTCSFPVCEALPFITQLTC